jgi:hypothetical protein
VVTFGRDPSIGVAGVPLERPKKTQKTLGLHALVFLFGVAVLASSCARWNSDHVTTPLEGGTIVAVKSLGRGRIQLERDNQELIVDLTQEISGCTVDLYDPTVKEKYKSAASFEIVDATEKAPYTYLVLLVSAPPNCNVQGECGAAESPDSTLIWLKLTKDLLLAGKQAFAIDDCRAGRYEEIPREEDSDNDYVELQAKDLPWIGDALQIEFPAEDPIRRLIYDRGNPDAGLQQIP